MSDPSPWVSTGHLPPPDSVRRLMDEAYQRYRGVSDGAVADYIPALAAASPDLFGVAVIGVEGHGYELGDSREPFTIQSVSKPFLFALVCDHLGVEVAREHLGVNSTGFSFNSVIAVEANQDRTGNPMVNAGAIATTSLVPGSDLEERWELVRSGLSRFAGRDLVMDEKVYESETATNQRNLGIAHLLAGHGRIYSDPIEATDLYTRQCSLSVTAFDLAVMGSTLADGGVNPVTKERVVSADTCQRVLAVMATAGLYELSGDWLYDIGLPGKSGVSGGMVTISPGKAALGVYSPPLDEAGNSVRGRLVTRFLSQSLGLSVFASQPAEG